MVRRIYLLLILVTGATPGRAQDTRYWVFFTDKPESVVADDATGRALERRRVRGTGNTSLVDRPVDESYVHRIATLGADPFVRSRWLNAVSAAMDETTRDEVAALPFVREVRPLGPPLRTAELVEPTPWPLVSAVADQPAGLVIDYGASFNQLDIAGFIPLIEAGINGAGVRLGVIDTIADHLDHPATRHLIDDGQILGQEDFLPDPLAAETHYHARNCLAVAAAFDEGNMIGPAYGAEILLARSEYVREELNLEEDAFVHAIEWMEAQGADVVTISLGYTTFDAGQHSYTYEDMDGDTAITTVAADLAVQHGVVVVNTAGNEGGCDPAQPGCWYYIGSPADGDSVITVGGVRPTGARYAASSWGPTADGRIKPDVAAQGTGVRVPIDPVSEDGAYYSNFGAGTSYAAPMVAAAAVLLLQVNPTLTPIEIRDILRTTASQAQNPTNSLGWGIINAEAAVALATAVDSSELPQTVVLDAFPNPFGERVRIEAAVPDATAPVTVELVDLLGRVVWSGTRRPLVGNRVEFDVDGRTLPAGVLVYRVGNGRRFVTGTLVHLR